MARETHNKKLSREKRVLRRIKKYEKKFSSHKYRGRGKTTVETINGRSCVGITASHSVNCFDGEQVQANAGTGGLVCLLAYEIGCHAICVRKSFNQEEFARTVQAISESIKNEKIEILVDFVVQDFNSDAWIGIKTDAKSEETDESKEKNSIAKRTNFIKRAITYSFEYKFREDQCNEVVKEIAEEEENISSKAAHACGISYVRIEINEKHFSKKDSSDLLKLNEALKDTLEMLSNMDWSAESIEVYRLGQAMSHKPQDKIEIAFGRKSRFPENSLLNICTYGFELEKVRLRKANNKTKENITKYDDGYGEKRNSEEYVFLTNRLIEILFGRNWIEGKESIPGLIGAPIIVYENMKEEYGIGLPMANQIDGVFFSEELFNEKKEESKLFDYVIFNRYTDSRLYIEFDKANYNDNGRVKGKKVMIPRYYKTLLGYMDYPLKMIRSEEYTELIKRIKADATIDDVKKKAEEEAFSQCYEKIDNEVFYKLKKKFETNYDNDEESQEQDAQEIRRVKDEVIDAQNRYKLFNKVEILRVPKEVKSKERITKRIMHKIDTFRIWVLTKIIGKADYLLKTEWASETDDRNNIARLSPNMMSLLGISENDKIIIHFGREQEILRALANERLTDYQIGIPAPARKRLGMNSVNDIVLVHRDMIHIFLRHSEQQTLAILGTVLAVFQVVTQTWIGVIFCVIVTPIIMYFVLNEERLKVK